MSVACPTKNPTKAPAVSQETQATGIDPKLRPMELGRHSMLLHHLCLPCLEDLMSIDPFPLLTEHIDLEDAWGKSGSPHPSPESISSFPFLLHFSCCCRRLYFMRALTKAVRYLSARVSFSRGSVKQDAYGVSALGRRLAKAVPSLVL